jgi:tetratricopeptide (TPR) repeat protein
MTSSYEKSAYDFFYKKHYQRAIDQCITGLNSNPDNIVLLYLLAKSHFNLNDIKTCEDILIKIIKLQPNEFEANYLLGILYLKQKRYKEAIDILNRTDNKYPGKWKLQMYLSEAFLGIKDFDNALLAAKNALSTNYSIFNIYNIIRIVIFKRKLLTLVVYIILGLLSFILPLEIAMISFFLFMLYPIIAALALISEKHFVNGIVVVLYLSIFTYIYWFIRIAN